MDKALLASLKMAHGIFGFQCRGARGKYLSAHPVELVGRNDGGLHARYIESGDFHAVSPNVVQDGLARRQRAQFLSSDVKDVLLAMNGGGKVLVQGLDAFAIPLRLRRPVRLPFRNHFPNTTPDRPADALANGD